MADKKDNIQGIPDADLPEVTQKIRATVLLDSTQFNDAALDDIIQGKTKVTSTIRSRTVRTCENRTRQTGTQNGVGRESGSGTTSFATGIVDTWIRTVDFLSPSRIFSKTQNVDTIISEEGKNKAQEINEVKVTEDESHLETSFAKDFELKGEFARGGQGVLSEAKDLALERIVAIKTLRTDLKENTEKRSDFLREARVTAQLEHPGIIPIYSMVSDENNGLHLSMKFVHGRSLKDYLTKITTTYDARGIGHMDEAASMRSRLEIFLQICDALAYAHSRNIMHCDLKPENVMLGEYHATYLLDWGIARKINDPDFNPATYVKPKSVVGTPRFLSPEAIRGEHFDHRSDIFAMGAFLYEVVTLQEAYTGDTPADIIRSIVSGDLPAVEHLYGCHIDTDLKKIIMKAMAYYPDDRYDSVSALAKDIRRYMANMETVANPDSPFRKLTRFISQHATGVLLVVLLCVLAFIGYFAYDLSVKIHNEQTESIRRSHITTAQRRCDDMAYRLDMTMSRYESDLVACVAQLNFLSINKTENKISDILKIYVHPQNDNDSGNYAIMSYTTAPDTDKTTLQERRKNVEALMPYIVKMMLESPVGSKRIFFDNAAEIESRYEEMAKHGAPISLVYVTYKDGLHFAYPAKVYARDYDPRNRGWYRKRMIPVKGTDGTIGLPGENDGWLPPYLNAAGDSVILSYVVRMSSKKEKNYGTIALDVNVNNLGASVLASEVTDDAVVERTIVDSDGNVLYSTNDKLQQEMLNWCNKNRDGGASAFAHPNKELIRKIKEPDYGYFQIDLNGRKVIIVYSQCRTSGWYYYEAIDVERMNDLGKLQMDDDKTDKVSK